MIINNDTFISITMATYNGEKFLEQQISSILNQTYTNFELIICDDCSTDKTKEILSNYAKKDTRIKLHFNEKNLGFKQNFEKCISFVQGEYIAFCDQDDIWESYKLEVSLQGIGTNDIYCSNAKFIDESNNSYNNITMMDYLSIRYIPDDNNRKARHFLHQNICQGATMFCRTDFIKASLPIPASFSYHDWYFALLAATQNGIFYDTNCTIQYRQHLKSVTGEKKAENFINQCFKVSKQNIINSNNISICEYISSSNIFPEEFKYYAKDCLNYYKKMSYNKDFSTFLFFTKNYDDFHWDKNKVHKTLFILKRFFGVIKFKITRRIKLLSSHPEEL